MKILKELVNREELDIEKQMNEDINEQIKKSKELGYRIYLVSKEEQEDINECLNYIDLNFGEELVDSIDLGLAKNLGLDQYDPLISMIYIKQDNVFIGGKMGLYNNKYDNKIYAIFCFRKDFIDRINNLKIN